jgi:hypothetical protein
MAGYNGACAIGFVGFDAVCGGAPYGMGGCEAPLGMAGGGIERFRVDEKSGLFGWGKLDGGELIG